LLREVSVAARTRLDRLVELRELQEQEALGALGRAQRDVAAARERLAARIDAAARDGRRPEDAALWALDDGARRRALQAVRAAEAEVGAALRVEEDARAAWTAAHNDTEAARRSAERKRAEARLDGERKERRAADEVASLRHGRER
jgi:flagellar biosynthesis chaperone FliJ